MILSCQGTKDILDFFFDSDRVSIRVDNPSKIQLRATSKSTFTGSRKFGPLPIRFQRRELDIILKSPVTICLWLGSQNFLSKLAHRQGILSGSL